LIAGAALVVVSVIGAIVYRDPAFLVEAILGGLTVVSSLATASSLRTSAGQFPPEPADLKSKP
jgi:hypothetical protein